MRIDTIILAGLLLIAGCIGVESAPEPAAIHVQPSEPVPNESIRETAAVPNKETAESINETGPDSTIPSVSASPLSLTSPSFEPGGKIPPKYTCDRENINPPLDLEGVPANAQSLVLIMDDPDAVGVVGYVWVHWVVFNIDPSTTIIQEGEEPPGVQGITSFNERGYGGPCPPTSQEHTYSFRLYALDTMLDLPEGSASAQVENAMEGHVIAQTELVGTYKRV